LQFSPLPPLKAFQTLDVETWLDLVPRLPLLFHKREVLFVFCVNIMFVSSRCEKQQTLLLLLTSLLKMALLIFRAERQLDWPFVASANLQLGG
jgi:hypothetical protein